MSDARFLLALGTLLVLAGLAYLAMPATIFAWFGVSLTDNPAALTDLRATYAGVQLGVGAVLIWCSAESAQRRAGLSLVVALFTSVGGVRLLGALIDGGHQWANIFATAAELLVGGYAGLRLIRM